MVQSEQHGITRRQRAHGRGRGPASGKAFWALAVAASLVVVIVFTAGCGSGTQAASNTTTKITSSSQSTTGQSTMGQSTTGQSTTGQSFPSGMPSGAPSGTRPSGSQGTTPASSGTASTTTTTAAGVDSTSTTAAPTTTTSLADDQYGDGIYKAGTDISSGLYKGKVAGADAHWEITKDANGARYVASGDPTGQFYVKATSGQYLHLTGVIIEKASSTALNPLASANLTNGTYRVGYDIAVGWYTGTVTGDTTMGYYQISSDANGQTLVASDYPLGSFTIKVTKGQYITLRGVTISLQE
jgi:hypothetical protein